MKKMKMVNLFSLPRERDEQEISYRAGKVNSLTRFTSFTTRVRAPDSSVGSPGMDTEAPSVASWRAEKGVA